MWELVTTFVPKCVRVRFIICKVLCLTRVRRRPPLVSARIRSVVCVMLPIVLIIVPPQSVTDKPSLVPVTLRPVPR